jgi:hypothetical protein
MHKSLCLIVALASVVSTGSAPAAPCDCVAPLPPAAPPPNDLYATAVNTSGTAWQVVFPDVTHDYFASGVSYEVYISPERRLPFLTTEIFLTKPVSGGSATLKLLFFDQSNPPITPSERPTVHLHHPAP